MKVTFITVCYNTPNLIRVLLRGAEQARFDFPFEYYLVDNGSDGTADMVEKRFPWVTVIRPGKNLGFAKANNLAMAQAKGEYVMLVNPDLTIFSGEMEKLLACADAHTDVGVLGPLLVAPNGVRQETCVRFPSPLIPIYQRTILGRTKQGKKTLDHYHMRDLDHTQMHDADSLYGAAMLLRSSALQDVGGFDERFFMYYEDVDLCRRMRANGWRVLFAPHAKFVHYHQRESLIRSPWEIATNRLVRIHIASGIRYLLKYMREPAPKSFDQVNGERVDSVGARRGVPEQSPFAEATGDREETLQRDLEGHEATS
ncbi:MAG: glycosyltransferase family 2 protein [Patescibacteria group bacterium]